MFSQGLRPSIDSLGLVAVESEWWVGVLDMPKLGFWLAAQKYFISSPENSKTAFYPINQLWVAVLYISDLRKYRPVQFRVRYCTETRNSCSNLIHEISAFPTV